VTKSVFQGILLIRTNVSAWRQCTFAISFCSGVYWSLLVLKYLIYRMLWRRHPIKQMGCLIYDRLKHSFSFSDCWLKHWRVLEWWLFSLWKGKFCSKNDLPAVTDV
jgi:hypothetical protein